MRPRRAIGACTLSEALLAWALSAGWLCASAALQRVALERTRQARQFAVATQQLAGMVALLQANRRGWSARAPLPQGGVDDCVRSACTPQALAAADFARWRAATARLLPGARADVDCAGAACRIAVRWPPRHVLRIRFVSDAPCAGGASGPLAVSRPCSARAGTP